MVIRKILLLGLCLFVAGVERFAQSVGEKTGVNSALGIAPKTSDFVKEAATSDMFEIPVSDQLAAQRTQGGVQSFPPIRWSPTTPRRPPNFESSGATIEGFPAIPNDKLAA